MFILTLNWIKHLKIKKNTLQKHEEKYGAIYRRSVKVNCVAEFSDKIKNESKNMTIGRYSTIG